MGTGLPIGNRLDKAGITGYIVNRVKPYYRKEEQAI